MKRRPIGGAKTFLMVPALFLVLAAPACRAEQPTPAAVSGFDSYIRDLEARLIRQHQSKDGFLSPPDEAHLRNGELVIEKIPPEPAADRVLDLSGAAVHDWRGTAFARGVHAADFERLMRDYPHYPQSFSPEVLSATILSHHGDRYQVAMRVRQKHVLTVVLDTTYDVTFGRLDRRRGYSISRSTQISEIASAGEPGEHALPPAQNHGFLWRLNTYWSYEERDGGLYLQVESVSLTRAIPPGLGWAIGPFVESVPRESLEFTLHAACAALRKSGDPGSKAVEEGKVP